MAARTIDSGSVDPEPDRRRPVLDQGTLVLNRVWVPITVTTVRRAVVMVYQDAARVVCGETLQTHDFGGWLTGFQPDAVSRWIRGVTGAVPAPDIIQLTRYDRVPAHEAPFTRRNLFQRDEYTCQYCGRRGGDAALSVDHVVPRSRGGSTTWDNCVLACVRCNTRKGSRTPRQAGMRLRAEPKRPRWSPYLSVRPGDWMESWRRFASPHDLQRLERNRARA